jgi:hypothetical protein
MYFCMIIRQNSHVIWLVKREIQGSNSLLLHTYRLTCVATCIQCGLDILLILPFEAVRSNCKQFFSVLKKKQLDYDTGKSMRLWNVENVVSVVLSAIRCIIRSFLMHIQKTSHVTVIWLLQTVDEHRCSLQQDLVNVVFSCYISSSYIIIAVYPI